MLLVKTTIGPSKIHEIGLFAAEPIPKGTIIWMFHALFDRVYTMAMIEVLPELQRNCLMKYGYINPMGVLVVCCDDARHFNHSLTPNTLSETSAVCAEGLTVASQDINIGDELTSNYFLDDADGARKLKAS